ncbi:MAG: formate dehydrogenase accessory sulfurtransferase FdhD [Acidobacteriota bacterium]
MSSSPPDGQPRHASDTTPVASTDAEASSTPAQIWALDSEGAVPMPDALAREEPLEIRLTGDGAALRSHGISLRTPGQDEELVRGLLFAEGVIQSAKDLLAFEHLPPAAGVRRESVAVARLRAGLVPQGPPRAFVASSACGMCGQVDLSALWLEPANGGISDESARRKPARFEPSVLLSLPAALGQAQSTFRRTGGLHAAALFSPDGKLLVVREDIGRHNALDKVIGWALQRDLLPLHNYGLLVSGRAGYELAHKAVRASAALLAAVSAPSSLAVATAQRFGLTLVGFLREGRCNVYSGGERLGIEE